MPIKCSITQRDIEEINASRLKWQKPLVSIDGLAGLAELALGEMGISDADVSVIRARDRVCFGAARVPLLVSEPHRKFVVKQYDKKGAGYERKILEALQEKLAPSKIHYGEKFIAEELVDSSVFKPLHVSFNQGLVEGEGHLDKYAVMTGAEIHADLAKERIIYNHDHWLDEFHVNDKRSVITDLGSAVFFAKPGKSRRFDEMLAFVEKAGIGEFIELCRPIPFFEPGSPAYAHIKQSLEKLEKDPAAALNIMYALGTAVEGIQAQHIYLFLPDDHEPSLGEIKAARKNAEGYARRVLPFMAAAFVERYNPELAA